jgi:prepilin-type N-terminal cleavage/methylation domain-containing protein
MKRMQAGFTMIELIVVIVILGVLAAVAMPKFVDVSSEAKAAALQGVAGAATSAMNVNYGARKVAPAKGVAVANCSDLQNVLQGGVPAGYTVTAAAIAAEASVSCTITQDDGGNTATFTGLGIN